jgi:hypothetical protein
MRLEIPYRKILSWLFSCFPFLSIYFSENAAVQWGGEVYESNDDDDPQYWDKQFGAPTAAAAFVNLQEIDEATAMDIALADSTSRPYAPNYGGHAAPPPLNSYKNPVGYEPDATAGADDTPLFIVSSRTHITTNYANNCSNMEKAVRKRHVKVTKALSHPYDQAYTNTLKSVQEKPTPERAQTIMDYAEDMEEDWFHFCLLYFILESKL